jgi:hypothetical protein
MDLLPLDDSRWIELDHRNWRDGKRSEWAPDGPFVPDELAKLSKNPEDLERFTNLWPWLCSEGTTYAAAYAAAPYFVAFARRLPPEKRFDYLCVIGLIVTHSVPDQKSCEIRDYLVDSYQSALSVAMTLVAETLVARHDVSQTRYLLATVAALKGHRKLAEVLQDLDCICAECPACGADVYPEELQAALS